MVIFYPGSLVSVKQRDRICLEHGSQEVMRFDPCEPVEYGIVVSMITDESLISKLYVDGNVHDYHTRSIKKVGAKLTKLSKDQADYISVGVEGPFKPNAYRY